MNGQSRGRGVVSRRGGVKRGAVAGAGARLGAGLLAFAASAGQAETSPHAGMLRFPDVSASQIVFVYANDLWLVPREGGTALPLASPPGTEMFPKFSPDGASVVFQGNYEGNRDLYVMPVAGGVAERITHHPSVEMPTDWHAERGIVFFMSGLGGLARQQQIFTVSPSGGLPEMLPIPYGANGVFDAAGEWAAYTPNWRDFRTWKRYRGGLASDVWLFNTKTLASKQITDFDGTDTLPMWHGESVYFLSDRDDAHRLNIWAYNVKSGKTEQVTSFKEYDVKFPSIGPGPAGKGEIVFQNGPELYLLDLETRLPTPVRVTIPGARPTIRPREVDASEQVMSAAVSATGKRVVVEARGDVWTVPAENGSPRQITDTSGAAERTPAWSPDGRWIAYISDASGEYELWVTQSDGKGEPRQVTKGHKTYFHEINWAPDSEKLLLSDKAGRLLLVALESGEVKELDRDPWANEPLTASWSHDSAWVTYSRGTEESQIGSVWLCNVESGETHKVTSGFFADTEPVFSPTGEYLFYASARDFTSPTYEDVGSTFAYADTSKLIAVPLNEEVENKTLLKEDHEEWEEDEEDESDEEGDEGEEGDDDEDADDDEDGDDDEGDADDADDSDDADDDAEEAEGDDDAAGADDADGGDEVPAELKPIVGTWTGTAGGLKALGLPEDEIEFTMFIAALKDGTLVGASEGQGETNDYDYVRFDAAKGTFEAGRNQGPIESSIKATLTGTKLAGTWSVKGAVEGSGPWQAERGSEEVDTDRIDGYGDGESKGGKDKPVKIDLDGFEARGVELPVASGRFAGLAANDAGQLVYNRIARGGPPSVRLFDVTDEDGEEKTVLSGGVMVAMSGDWKKILVQQGENWGVVDAKPGQSVSKPVAADDLMKRVNPREEWEQIFTDAWRRHRDFFYVENMHGVDWDAVYAQYRPMLEDAASREDVGFIIGEMISELNVGHAYYSGGDVEDEPRRPVGMLGVDFELAEEKADDGQTLRGYRIKRLHRGAAWDSDARNPLEQHGMDVKEGTYITAVNGRPVRTDADPWAAFVGTAGKPTAITFADKLVGDDEARNERTHVVEPMGGEGDLRFRSWIEDNRRYVEEASSGKVGYIYVPNTGVDGQNELFRQFYGQAGKQALLIDERWNGGGQIPNRFIELLNRPRTNYWARRDGKDWPWPYDSHQGPKAMLVNGAAGSGGDMFPWLFKHHGLGKVFGTRTWGGLVGISGVPALIDGASTSVPNFGFYELDGTWGIEGHGVDPDVEVIDDPTRLARGERPQIDAAVRHLMDAVESSGYKPPRKPAAPNRRGMGIPRDDR